MIDEFKDGWATYEIAGLNRNNEEKDRKNKRRLQE